MMNEPWEEIQRTAFELRAEGIAIKTMELNSTSAILDWKAWQNRSRTRRVWDWLCGRRAPTTPMAWLLEKQIRETEAAMTEDISTPIYS